MVHNDGQWLSGIGLYLVGTVSRVLDDNNGPVKSIPVTLSLLGLVNRL